MKHSAVIQLMHRSGADLSSLTIARLATVDHMPAHQLEVGLCSSQRTLLTTTLHACLYICIKETQ